MPPPPCIVAFCKKNGSHNFPKDVPRRTQWIEAIEHKKPGLSIRKHSRICSDHFKPTDFSRTALALLQPNRTIVANKPDFVITDRSERRAILVDITISHDVNLEKDKESKYSDLAYEITAMWNVDSTSIVPIVVSANGPMAKSHDQHLKRLSLDSWIKGQIQKAVLFDTARQKVPLSVVF